MEELKDSLLDDILVFTKKCQSLSIHSSEYAYWNGCRCQAEVTLKKVKELS
jgi:hypothetical protein